MLLKSIRFASACALFLAAIFISYEAISLFLQATITAKLGVLTAAVSVTTFIYNNNRQQAREIRARQFADKRVAYQKFFDFMFDIFSAHKVGMDLADDEKIKRMEDIVKDLMVWGSANTINEYNSYLRKVQTTRDGSLDIFNNVETLLRAFRKDLGHDDRPLEKLGLTKVLVKAEEHSQLDAGIIIT